MFGGRLTLLCAEGHPEFLFDDLRLARRIVFPVSSKNGVREFDAEALAKQVGLCDLFISLVPWISNSLLRLARYLAPSPSAGFFPDYTVQVGNDCKHAAHTAFDVVRYFEPDLRFEDFAAPPCYPSACLDTARRIRGMLPRDARVLAVHADTSPEKMWSSERFIAALDLFLERHHEFFVFLVGWTPQALDRGSHGDRVISAYHLPFDAMCALVASADLFLGVDSCMLHLADLELIPSVGLFGQTRAAEFGFMVGPNVTLQSTGGMDMISHRRVALALESLLSNPIQSAVWMIEDP